MRCSAARDGTAGGVDCAVLGPEERDALDSDLAGYRTGPHAPELAGHLSVPPQGSVAGG